MLRTPSVDGDSGETQDQDQDQLMKDTFPKPLLVAHKRQRKLGDFFIRAKVNP